MGRNFKLRRTDVGVVNMDIFEYLRKYNEGAGEFVRAEARIYYVLKDKDIVDCFKINKRHTLAESNKIVKELMEIIYDGSHVVEYTGQIEYGSYIMSDYTEENEYFEHMAHLFVY